MELIGYNRWTKDLNSVCLTKRVVTMLYNSFVYNDLKVMLTTMCDLFE